MDPEPPTPTEITDPRGLLLDNQPSARLWWWGWLGGFSALTVGQGVVAAASSDRDARASALIGGASSAVGVLNLVVSPYPGRHARADLERSGDDGAAVRDLLERTAAAERFQTGPLAHLGGLVVSAAPAAVVWLALDRPADAALDLAGGVVLTEAQILSSPHRVRRAVDDHRLVAGWVVVPGPDGWTVAGRF